MKIIKISYKGETFEVQLTRIKAYPYDVFEIDLTNNPKLTAIIESPVYIIEMPYKLSFSELQNVEQIDLLMSFAEGIEENNSI